MCHEPLTKKQSGACCQENDSVHCVLCSVEGEAPGCKLGAAVDSTGSYGCVPVIHSGGLSPDHLDSQLYAHIFLPGHSRPRRTKFPHSQSILRKQAEEEAIKRSRSLSESYELSSDLQDKQVRGAGQRSCRNTEDRENIYIYIIYQKSVTMQQLHVTSVVLFNRLRD